ncbi:hypothetical protein [Nostoc sp. TCL26-01]|nr:hypothetical protein [Nostoc sp. TCL26-01]
MARFPVDNPKSKVIITALNELKQSSSQKAFMGELTADTLKASQEEIAL